MTTRTLLHLLGIGDHDERKLPAPDRLAAAFRSEELKGLKLATWGRTAALAVIAAMLFEIVDVPAVYYYEALLAIFVALGFAHFWLTGSGLARPSIGYLFVALDAALLTVTLVVPNPLEAELFPAQMGLRNDPIVYFFLFAGIASFSCSPRLMLWTGFATALAWLGGLVWVLSRPDTRSLFDGSHRGMSRPAHIAEHLHPNYVETNVVLIQDTVVLLLMTGLLALLVLRSRRLVIRQAAAARERTNLARYFPPTIVDQLAELDEPLGPVRAQPVAVLFADIVGFTRYAEREQPGQVVAMLRAFHTRMERAVFDHGGTLDKFLGDGVMATFGTPNPGPRDAVNALACARTMLADIEAWNGERVRAGAAAIKLSVGIHYGNVILGDVGSERRLEFAVLGDVVNVASRLEELTRTIPCRVVASDALVQAARTQVGGEANALLAGFRRGKPQALRGRQKRVPFWTLDPVSA